jgi:hypothetical protein
MSPLAVPADKPALPVPRLSFPQFVWLWNRLENRGLPGVHAEIAIWLDRAWARRDPRLLLMAFRDAGKSTLVGLFCAWLLTRNADLRILVLAADGELARKMTRSVRRLIERHPASRRLVPERPEQWAADRFSVRRKLVQRDPSLLARGISANITGSRADVVICDDVEVPNTADTAPKRKELRERLGEIAYVLVPGGTQLFVGTPHAYESIYAAEARAELGESEPFLHGFERLVLPIVDEEGRSRWPERFGADEIEEIRRRTGPAKFTSQMLLQPCSLEDMRLDPAQLRRYGEHLSLHEANGEARLMLGERLLVGAACWWDPAFGRAGRGDASVVAVVFADAEGGYYLHALEYLTQEANAPGGADPATQLCRKVCAFARTFHVPTIAVESNGIGKFLPALLRRELRAQSVGAAVVEETATRNKDSRILEAFDPVLAAGALHAHESVWRTPFVQEMREWRPGANGRDDGLDAVAGCLLSTPVRLGRLPPAPRRDWRPGASAWRAVADFSL